MTGRKHISVLESVLLFAFLNGGPLSLSPCTTTRVPNHYCLAVALVVAEVPGAYLRKTEFHMRQSRRASRPTGMF